MKWRGVLGLAGALALSIGALGAVHYNGDPSWMDHLPAAPGGDGVLWQVHTTFLSVGFAGLAIAAQLFADAPLAIGASRGRVLQYIWAAWFAGVGLAANAVIAIQTIWFPSDLGVLAITLLWFLPTVALLVLSTLRLMRLFGNPSLLDELVRHSLVETLGSRLDSVARKYGAARRQLDGLFSSGVLGEGLGPSGVTLRVPVPRVGLIIKAIKPHIVRQAIATLAPKVTEGGSGASVTGDVYVPPQITLDVEPGDRTRLGETAFRVSTSREIDPTEHGRLVRLLQSSIEFESPGSVTPDEETDREIANLKDTIGTSLRAGAYGTAERALQLLGEVVRGVWMAHPESLNSSQRSSFTRRDWYQSIGETEQDALLSPRAAELFVGQAMTRALEAPRTGSTEYVDECLRSFTRLWFAILRDGGSEFASLPSRISTSLQNLAAFAYTTGKQPEDLRARAIWAMVELVKLALDAEKPQAARLAAEELGGLFEYSERGGSGRAHVRAGQLVLSGWLAYLSDKKDKRDPSDPQLGALVKPTGTWPEILAGRELADRGAAPFSRWDWWEMQTASSRHAQVLQLSSYIDRAALAALASSYGPLPPAADQHTASTYQRFTRLLEEDSHQLTVQEARLKQKLTDEVGKWEAAENELLAKEPLSHEKIAALGTALRESLDTSQRLADLIPAVDEVPDAVDQSRPILGMNLRVPRHSLVGPVFNQTYANPRNLGQMIARAFTDGEERRILGALRSHQHDVLDPTVHAIRRRIDGLGDDAGNYVLATPYGGLMDIDGWYTTEFRDALARVTHVESAALDTEAILFDRRAAVLSCREPEEKDGLTPIQGTSIALGVFEDVDDDNEPQVRIETGELFIVWATDTSRIHRFAPSRTGEERAVEAGGALPALRT